MGGRYQRNISLIDEGWIMKTSDKRCCGSGVCIINAAGECWCGQVWDGKKMAAPKLNLQTTIPEHEKQDLKKDLSK